MKKSIQHHSFFFSCLLALVLGMYAAPAKAQSDDFSPYKGVCWGLFYDRTAQNPLNYLVPVTYVRPTWDMYVFPDFVGCGRDLIIKITGLNEDPEYYDIHLEMEGAQYDEKGYFYAPFNAGEHKWTISAPYGELMGPIHQTGSYYSDPYEYFGLYYVRYTEGTEFAYFDIKTQEDYNESVPRTYISEEEAAQYTGVKPVVMAPVQDDTFYDLLGRMNTSAMKGVKIENGRKVLR